ncbi:MAG: type IX secretion system membrane protein PorP/SprF, partial [Flavobacteriaceae bacterium]
MKFNIYKIVFLVAFSVQVKAQDPVFTQFLLIPETINPGFTGAASAWNAGIIHRRQWPQANRRIDTQYAFANNLVTDNLGIGITVLNQKETFTNYNYF